MEEHKTYVVFNAINPAARTVASVFLVAIGYMFQLVSRNIIVGLPFIVACVILNLIKSINIKQSVVEKYTWQEVTPAKIDQVIEHCRKIKKFNTSSIGCFILVIFVFVIGVTFVMPIVHILTHISFAFAATIANAVILFGGLVFSGRRRAWMPHNLDIKARIVKRMTEHTTVKTDPGVTAIPYLRIGQGTNGSVPNDARFMIRFENAPKDFLGIQGQISINKVKSRAYPYFYAVILAKPAFKLFKKFGTHTIKKCVIERKKTSEVDVLVIRQRTTKTSGYHTNEEMQDHIVNNALDLTKKMLSAHI